MRSFTSIMFTSNSSQLWFRIHLRCLTHTFKPFPLTGKAKISGKIKSVDLERQDDAVLNTIEGLNDGLFHSCFDFTVPVSSPPLLTGNCAVILRIIKSA